MISGTFPVLGEALALELVNTSVQGPDGPADLIATPDGLAAWLAAEGDRLPAPDGPVDADTVAAVRALRTDVGVVLAHLRRGGDPPATALAALNRAARAATLHRELDWAGARLTARPRWTGAYAARLRAHLANAAIDLLDNLDPTTVHECAAPDCVMLFVPAHPRRQWCSPACGNRVRVARYYHRHKAGEGARPEILRSGAEDPSR